MRKLIIFGQQIWFRVKSHKSTKNVNKSSPEPGQALDGPVFNTQDSHSLVDFLLFYLFSSALITHLTLLLPPFTMFWVRLEKNHRVKIWLLLVNYNYYVPIYRKITLVIRSCHGGNQGETIGRPWTNDLLSHFTQQQ